jgi:esterase/lipase superfamily enzyme
MPKYWMISNRNVQGSGSNRTLGKDRGDLSFYVSDSDTLTKLSNWTSLKQDKFQSMLVAAANRFPDVPEAAHEEQKHVTILIHGYDNSWTSAVGRYQSMVEKLFSGEDSMGICILFTWPSKGEAAAYLPDRKSARESADDLAEVLSELYDWLLDKQTECLTGSGTTCKAKTSVIAHSMGNYLLQCAMQSVWTRKNQPLLVSLINQLLMVAADVDNDIFKSGEDVGDGDGEGIANLSYRVTALYSGRDAVLGLSAGLKHFGKRRLGRSGLDQSYRVPDNVWDVDCSDWFKKIDGKAVHSAYFDVGETIALMRETLRGIDRDVMRDEGTAPPDENVAVAPTAPGNRT